MLEQRRIEMNTIRIDNLPKREPKVTIGDREMDVQEMNGKKIKAAWWPDNGVERGRNIKSGRGNACIAMAPSRHVDHDSCLWIMEYDNAGKEIKRHNPYFVKTIEWE